MGTNDAFLRTSILLLFGCASGLDLETDVPKSNEPTVESKQRSSQCEQRWRVNSSIPAARNVGHSGARSTCAGRAQKGAVTLGNYIREHFAHAMDLSVPGRGVQIYNCRSVRGGRSNSVHGDGRAVDIFIPTLPGGVADNAKGDQIADWLVANAALIGIQYIIWDRGSFRGNRSPQSKCYTGSHPHNDHIHLELTWAAANEESPFFNQNASNPEPTTTASQPDENINERSTSAHNHEHDNEINDSDPNTGTDSQHEEVDSTISENAPVPEPVSGTAWLGEPCSQDANCISEAGLSPVCIKPEGTQWGFCSVSCDGLCPDRPGHSETFCASARMVGFHDVGMCMAKATPGNGFCGIWPDFEAFSADRFVDESNARARTSTVCAVAPPRSVASEDSTADEALIACGEHILPLSDHGRSCELEDQGRWRCACSERYQTTVSQVCRGGAWVNYDLDPVDCSRCDGDYSSGCEPR